MKKLFRLSAVSFSFKLVNMAAMFVFTMLGAKFLGVEGFGLYSYAITIVMLLSIPIKAGLPVLVIRETSKYSVLEQWPKVAGIRRYATYIVASASLAISLISVVFIWFFYSGAEEYGKVFITSILLMPVLAFNAVRSALLQGMKKIVYAQIPEMIVLPLLLLAAMVIALIVGSLSPGSLMVGHVGAALGALLIGEILLRKSAPRETFSASKEFEVREWSKSLLPLSLLSGVQVVNALADVFFVGLITGMGEVGIYKVATQFAAAMSLPVVTASVVISPYVASYYSENNLVEVARVIRFACLLSLCASVGIFLLIYMLSDVLINRFLGDGYATAVVPLYIICLSNLGFALFGPVLNVANMVGLERESARAAVLGVAINVVLCLLLIPKFGIVGAAIATAIATLCWKLLLVRLVYKNTGLLCFIFTRISV